MIDALTGSLIGVLYIALAVGFVLWVLSVIAHWRMFTKAGEKGWKSLIPVYSDYVLFRLSWNTRSFWVWFGAGVVMAVVSMMTTEYVVSASGELYSMSTGNIFTSAITFIASLVSLFWSGMLCLRMAVAYGKKPSFGIGLLILPQIFKMIIAFGSAEYRGPQE